MKITINYGKPKLVKKNYSGATLDDAADAMDKNGFWGRYVSNRDWSYNTNNGAVTEVTITAKPEIIMPVWKGWSKAEREDQKTWDIMWVRLKRHEEHHHKIAQDLVSKLEKELKKGAPYGEPVFLKRMEKFDTDFQAAQDAYDKKTDHGVKEGVKL